MLKILPKYSFNRQKKGFAIQKNNIHENKLLFSTLIIIH